MKTEKFIHKMYVLALPLLLTYSSPTLAQSAKELLKEVEQCYIQSNGIEANYTLCMLDASSNELGTLDGIIKMDGKQFMLNTEGIQVWFDGITMWSLLEGTEEVNITTPDEVELQNINPFFLLTLYEESYKAQLANNNRVILTPIIIDSEVQSIELTIGKDEKLPTAILWKGSDGNVLDINVTSYTRNLQFDKGEFSFDATKYPEVEIIDLR